MTNGPVCSSGWARVGEDVVERSHVDPLDALVVDGDVAQAAHEVVSSKQGPVGAALCKGESNQPG